MKEEGAWQLTIDGGAVKHPPPRPVVTCPDCDKSVTLTVGGLYHKHSNGFGEECPRSGTGYRR